MLYIPISNTIFIPRRRVSRPTLDSRFRGNDKVWSFLCQNKHPLGVFMLLAMALCVLSGCSGCTSGGRNLTNIELFQDMMQQPSIKEQEGGSKGDLLMRHPPAHTKARNHSYYKYVGNPEGAANNLSNPFAGEFSPAVIYLGHRQYEKTCIVCHGAKGDGNGLVSPKMAVKPPSLLTDKVRNYSDGRLYHIIHEGQGLMSSYKKQVFREKDRWALINYIRTLQQKALKKTIEKNIIKQKEVK